MRAEKGEGGGCTSLCRKEGRASFLFLHVGSCQSLFPGGAAKLAPVTLGIQDGPVMVST